MLKINYLTLMRYENVLLDARTSSINVKVLMINAEVSQDKTFLH